MQRVWGSLFSFFLIVIGFTSTVYSYTRVVPDGNLGSFRHGTYPSWGKRTHAGVDIISACGSNVYTLADGIVIDVVNSPTDRDFASTRLGYMVIIEHPAYVSGETFYTFYIHLQDPPSVHINDYVSGGLTVIGKVGKTGAANNVCHLHFEIRHFSSRYSRWGNIYGSGDKRNTSYFINSWEDPEVFFTLPFPSASQPALGDMQQQGARDGRFSYPIPGTFGEDAYWHNDWYLRWIDFNFAWDRVVRMYHVTYKLNSSFRYTGFVDPDSGTWSGWQQVP